jgi:hypothetical protein
MFICKRCGHEWTSRKENGKLPLACPSCKSYSWKDEKNTELENNITRIVEKMDELEAISGKMAIPKTELFEALKSLNENIVAQTIKAMLLTGDIFEPSEGFLQLTDVCVYKLSTQEGSI